MASAYVGAAELVDDVLRRGAELEARDASGYSALMYAINGGHEAIVRALLDAGADVDARDREGSTPLMFRRAARLDPRGEVAAGARRRRHRQADRRRSHRARRGGEERTRPCRRHPPFGHRLVVTTPRAWPQRYRVRLRLQSGEEVAIPVVTWLDEAKAIAMAVSHHVRGGEESEREPYQVFVDDLGPVPQDAAGRCASTGATWWAGWSSELRTLPDHRE